jgi:predicted secreted protein
MGKLLLFTWLMCATSFARDRQVINALGSSPKGQYVAIEEYGYDSHDRSYYSRIKLFNVWKKVSVEDSIEIRRKPLAATDLIQVRQEAKQKAAKILEKFNIPL